MTEVRQSIALVGMMGVGKSTVGRAVAVAMQAQYVDLDEWVEAHSGKPIWKLFKDDGEAAFRQWEAKGLRQLTEEASDQRYVLSTGGGRWKSRQPGFASIEVVDRMAGCQPRDVAPSCAARRPASTLAGEC
ncbi:hypothetical protein GCM10025857_37320 [Alicyclobacillus contaminans]|nr:hypothetical protein GCM10025857_37320 [Alicyclobacillus contaminans]